MAAGGGLRSSPSPCTGPASPAASLFDDYPNIVDNHGVQPPDASLPSLVRAALSSPASEFKRPLASLSFAANYLATGLDPYWMKLTNLVIHLLNGLLVFLLARLLLRSAPTEGPARPLQHGCRADRRRLDAAADQPHRRAVRRAAHGEHGEPVRAARADRLRRRAPPHAGLCLTGDPLLCPARKGGWEWSRLSSDIHGLILCVVSITMPTAIGILAKETAVMLPLYALLIEWALFRFRKSQEPTTSPQEGSAETRRLDFRIISLFLLVLVMPMVVGLAWLLPRHPETGSLGHPRFHPGHAPAQRGAHRGRLHRLDPAAHTRRAVVLSR